MKPPSRGCEAEESACAYLKTRGLTLLERNYRCRFGEIDLIMQDGESVVFVEVRMRRNPGFGGGGLASVDRNKRGKLAATARHYLLTHVPVRSARFDVVAIDADERIEWVRDAFEA